MMVLLMSTVLQVHNTRWIERRFLVGEFWHPFRQPLLVRGRDFGRDGGRITIARHPPISSAAHRAPVRIADQADFGLDILVEMTVERRMDDGLALWHCDANEVSVSGTATPKITPACREISAPRGTASPPEPSDSGCVSETTICRQGLS
jgi:hypothetical protein